MKKEPRYIFSFRIPQIIHDRVKKIADAERRSLTQQILSVLENWLAQREIK